MGSFAGNCKSTRTCRKRASDSVNATVSVSNLMRSTDVNSKLRYFNNGRMRSITLPTRRRAAGVVAAALGLSLLAPAAMAQTPLPGGAEAINETYQDWQMACVQPQGVKRCAVTQQQSDEKTKQRVLVVELQPRGDRAEGVLIMPFGLAIDKGVSLKAGDAELGLALRFKTCLPQGCIVPLSLDAKAMAVLRKASVLTIGAFGDGDQPANLSVSLKGFVPAFDRAAALAR